jgi:hypothetical protein
MEGRIAHPIAQIAWIPPAAVVWVDSGYAPDLGRETGKSPEDDALSVEVLVPVKGMGSKSPRTTKPPGGPEYLAVGDRSTRSLLAQIADSRVRAGGEIVVVQCAREPATGVASRSHRGGTAWEILTAEARCWILTRTLR